MDRANAEAAINSVFRTYGIARSAIPAGASSHARGKVYELYVLTLVIHHLQVLGYTISFSHPRGTVQFKSSPGLLKTTDPHFGVSRPGSRPSFDIYVDVEFQTLGSSLGPSTVNSDLSAHHEIDIGVFNHGLNNIRPAHVDVALAVECKAVVSLPKSVIRGMLGHRRELSFFTSPRSSVPAQTVGSAEPYVPADPASEVWLVTTDANVSMYSNSPGAFGITCRHEDP